jgi:hypothetical protein
MALTVDKSGDSDSGASAADGDIGTGVGVHKSLGAGLSDVKHSVEPVTTS